MDVELRIHIEPTVDGDSHSWVWWAESEQVPGFTAAADRLPELLTKAEAALRYEGIVSEGDQIRQVLVPTDRPSEPALVYVEVGERPPWATSEKPRGVVTRQAIDTQLLTSA